MYFSPIYHILVSPPARLGPIVKTYIFVTRRQAHHDELLVKPLLFAAVCFFWFRSFSVPRLTVTIPIPVLKVKQLEHERASSSSHVNVRWNASEAEQAKSAAAWKAELSQLQQ